MSNSIPINRKIGDFVKVKNLTKENDIERIYEVVSISISAFLNEDNVEEQIIYLETVDVLDKDGDSYYIEKNKTILATEDEVELYEKTFVNNSNNDNEKSIFHTEKQLYTESNPEENISLQSQLLERTVDEVLDEYLDLKCISEITNDKTFYKKRIQELKVEFKNITSPHLNSSEFWSEGLLA